MKKKFFWSVSIFYLLVSTLLYPGVFPQDQKENRQKKKEPHSLVRRDLLTPTRKFLPAAQRNIFTRQRTASGEEGIPFSGAADFQTPEQIKSASQPVSAVEEVRSIIRYIGYVRSGDRVVALIIVEGNTYAVESGDVLEMGVSISEITPNEIEISDRGSEPVRISLEGEKP